ncbi:MAG: hypothetical protein WCK05_14610, partial [Planctomycetota bacterium]
CSLRRILWQEGGSCPDVPPAHVPAYYSGHNVMYWFQLECIHLVGYDLATSMDYLSHLTDSSGHPVDMYEQRHHRYPCPVNIPKELCHQHDKAFLRPAQTIESALAPDLATSFSQLHDWFDPEFAAFDDDVKVFVSESHLAFGQEHKDYSPAVISLCKGYETMVRRLLAPIIKQLLGPDASDITLDKSKDNKAPLTLADYDYSTCRRIVGFRPLTKALFTSRVCDLLRRRTREALSRETTWLFGPKGEHFKQAFLPLWDKVRNPAAHAERLTRHDVAPLYDVTLCKNKDESFLIRMSRAHEHLRSLLP